MSSDSSSDSDDVFARALARHRPSTLSASTKSASAAKPDSRASAAQRKAVPSFGSVPVANGGDGKGKDTEKTKPIAALFGPVPDLPPPASAPVPAPAPAPVSAPTAAAAAVSASTSSQSRATRVFSAPKQAPLPPPKVPYPANTTPLPVPSSNPFVAHAAGAGAGPVSWLEQAPHAPELSLFSPQAVAITAAAAQHAALFSEHIQQKSTPEAKVGPGSGVRGIVREFGHVHTVAPVSDGDGVWVVPVGPLLPPPVHHTNATTTTTTSSSSNSNTTAKFKTPTMSHLKITAADAKPLLASHSNVSRAKANATHSFVGVGVDVPPPQAPAGFFSNKDSFSSGVVLAPPTLPAVPLPTVPPAPPMAPGRLGHPVRLVANVGKVEFSPTAAFGVFDVAFEPPISVAAHRCDVFSAAIATSPLASSLSLCFDGSKQAFSPAPLTSFGAPWPLRARVLPPYLVAAARDVPEDKFLDECGVTVTVTPQSEPIPLSLLVTYAKQARAWAAAGGDVEVRPPQLPSHVLRAVNALVRSTLVANSGAEVGVLGTLLQALSRAHGGKGSMGSLLLSPPLLLPRLHNALPLPSSGGAVARSALYLASRLTQAGLVVSADVRTFATTAPLPLTRLVELMAEADAAPGYLVGSKGETASLPQPQYRLSKRLQGLRVVTTHRSVRTYTITGVAPPADFVTLSVGSSKITLTEFFRSKFHVILPNSSTLPCVKAGDHITLPLAVCSVLPDQCAGGQFPQKAKMTLREGSCLPAADRKKIVAASLALASSSSSSSIRISPSLLSVQARVLPPFPVFTAPHTGEVRALPPRVAKEWKAKADERLAYAPPTIGGGGEEKEGETKRKKRLRGGVLSSDDAATLEVAAAAEETAAVIKAKDEAAAAAAAFTTPGTVPQSEPVLVRPFSGPAAASSTTGVPVCCDPSPPQGPPALLSFSSGTRREPVFLPAEGTSGAALPLHDVSTPHTCLPPSGAAVCTQTVPVLGAWTTRARRLIDPRHVDAPLVLNAATGQGAGSTDDVYSFFGTLMSTAADMGLSIAPLRAVFPAMNPIVAEQRLARAFSDPSTRPDVVFVVTSSPSQCPVYAAVKHLCLVKYGCVSQGISGAKLASRSTWVHGYFANLTLKLNAKLGGLAFACPPPAALTNTPTLVLGCDADHPTRALRSTGGATGDAEYSFSAVVGSRDLAATRFAGVLQQQGIEQELLPLPHMAHAVRRHVAEFTRSTGRIPARIVMFRDGVADSQRRAVAVQEVTAIKAACRGIESGYEPEVVFVLCVKRHTVRFWPDDSKDAPSSIAEHNAAANMPLGTYTTHPVMHAPVPGTVVDDPAIARADGNEFYLLSHHAHRGTPHPVCYQVVVNEAKLSADEVQELAYYLCHGAQRVAKTSNVPAVALHAHLMCRGGKYLSKKYEPRALVDAAARGASIDAPYAPPTGGANKGPEVWEGYVHPDLWELPFYM